MKYPDMPMLELKKRLVAAATKAKARGGSPVEENRGKKGANMGEAVVPCEVPDQECKSVLKLQQVGIPSSVVRGDMVIFRRTIRAKTSTPCKISRVVHIKCP